MCIREHLQEGGLHKERQSQLVREREGLCQPEEHAVLGRQSRRRSQRDQGLYPTQTGDGDAQRGEAAQSRANSAEQENGALLRAGPHRHHGGHQAGERRGEEDLHTGRQTGRTH